jgi:hypothetical protein
MRLILGSRALLLGPAIALTLASGCGASEGSRCQINSDCASGLICLEGSTGNGVCRPSAATGATSTDAAAQPDANLPTGPEVEPVVDAEAPADLEPVLDAEAPADLEPAIDAEAPADMERAAEVGQTADGAALAEVGVDTLADATASVDSDTTSTP